MSDGCVDLQQVVEPPPVGRCARSRPWGPLLTLLPDSPEMNKLIFFWENYSEKVVFLLHIKSVCTLEKRKEISFVTKELFTTLIPSAPSFPFPTKISYDKQISDTKAS